MILNRLENYHNIIFLMKNTYLKSKITELISIIENLNRQTLIIHIKINL
jgi:hypothetical protein